MFVLRGGESQRECERRALARECHACVYVRREVERGRVSESERASEREREMLTLAINTLAIIFLLAYPAGLKLSKRVRP